MYHQGCLASYLDHNVPIMAKSTKIQRTMTRQQILMHLVPGTKVSRLFLNFWPSILPPRDRSFSDLPSIFEIVRSLERPLSKPFTSQTTLFQEQPLSRLITSETVNSRGHGRITHIRDCLLSKPFSFGTARFRDRPLFHLFLYFSISSNIFNNFDKFNIIKHVSFITDGYNGIKNFKKTRKIFKTSNFTTVKYNNTNAQWGWLDEYAP